MTEAVDTGTPAASEPTPAAADVNPASQDANPVDTPPSMGDPASAEQTTQVATEDKQPEQANEWLGAPEKGYSDQGFELAEGYEVDETTAEGLAGVCKDLGLSQKAFATIINRMTPVLEEAQNKQIQALKQENLKAFVADKELGGVRAKQTIAQAKLAYEKYCPAECREVLNRLGLDAHPGMIRMFYQLSQMLSDDISPRSSGASGNGYDLAKFFNNSKMN